MVHQMSCDIFNTWAATEVNTHERTVSLSQMGNAELARALSWRETVGWNSTDDFTVLIPIQLASQTKGWVSYRWESGVKLLHDWKNASKRCEFFGFYLYLCHVLLRFTLVLNCNTKISEKSDMTKSRALGFAACHKRELFVAQELINKLK